MTLQYLNLWKGTIRSPSLAGMQEQTFTLVVVYFMPWPLVGTGWLCILVTGPRSGSLVTLCSLQEPLERHCWAVCRVAEPLRCPAPLSPWPWAASPPSRLGTQSPVPAHSPGQLERPGLTCCLHTALHLLFVLLFPPSAAPHPAEHHGCPLGSGCARSLREGPCLSQQPAHPPQALFRRMCHKDSEHSWLTLFRHTDLSRGRSWQVSCASDWG